MAASVYVYSLAAYVNCVLLKNDTVVIFPQKITANRI
jgi:hypothetical protein